ncbi:MAG: zinc-ribbon domain-containing protein [Methanobrevibacter sp.]|nr:zinc-ribbon domain-containing protein [Methanosphaera sp.]MBR0369136.1 zinc-ribbon domain-containing protein [Methanobrevibacter sp.]
MSLFNRGDKKTPEEKYQELYNTNQGNIENADYVVRLDVAVGQYGNDDVVAGAMMGETGKLIAMSKYGDTKWKNTTMAMKHDGVIIHYTGEIVLYSDMREIRISSLDKSLYGYKQLIFVTNNGNYIFKGDAVFIDVITNLIVVSRDRYNGWISDGLISAGENLSDDEWTKLINGEPLKRKNTNNNNEGNSDLDRLLRAGELHERGLLSDEEFEDIKNKLLNKNNTESDINEVESPGMFCPSCGVEIKEEYKFCINCGHELK